MQAQAKKVVPNLKRKSKGLSPSKAQAQLNGHAIFKMQA